MSEELLFPSSEPGPCVIAIRKCADGSYLTKDSVVLEYRQVGADPKSATSKLRAPCDGIVKFNPGTRRGETIAPSAPVCTIAPCAHPIVMKDMCANCGMNLREKDGRAGQRAIVTAASVPMIHNVPELHVSKELAMHYGDKDRAHCLKSRKLVLLVDLDQTVIHTTNRPPKFDPTKHPDITHFHLFGGTHWTKLRPHTRSFFKALSSLYEMHIVTFGQRQYAHKIAEIIDPEKRIFEHRILSRDESFSQHHKSRNLSALFPVGEEMVAIIDDRPDVWEFSNALIQLRPYKYFPDVDDINAPPGSTSSNSAPPQVAERRESEQKDEEEETETSLLVDEEMKAETKEEEKKEKEAEDKKEEEEEDKEVEEQKKGEEKEYEHELPEDNDEALVHVETVLKNIHAEFYKKYDEHGVVKDLKLVISFLRAQVLKGCVIVLSGVVPIGMKANRSDAYRICVQFGARVAEKVDTQTTHVVAARWGTTKVHEAIRKGVPVVRPDWLYACLEQWRKVDESSFALSASADMPVGAPLGSSVVPDLAKIPSMGRDLLTDMTSEVDEALSEGGDDDDDDEDVQEENDEDVGEDEAEEEGGGGEEVSEEQVEPSSSFHVRHSSSSSSASLKRKLCPEARDRGYTGSKEEESDDDEDDDFGGPSTKRPKKGGEERNVEEEEDPALDDGEGEKDYAEGWDRGDEENEDEDDDEFDDMAAELEHQLGEN